MCFMLYIVCKGCYHSLTKMAIDTVFSIVVLIMSVVIHEVSHGFAADWLGDPTARLSGRLTLNPIKHLDPFGSVLVPLFLSLTHAGFVFGWAKPVPYNPYNLRNQKWGELVVALAGPASNIFIAVFFGILIRLAAAYNVTGAPTFIIVSSFVVVLNLVLAVFNLVPVPPLDGSKILFAFLPYHLGHIKATLERYGMVLILLFVLFLWPLVSPLVGVLFSLITGISV